jgi:hypothetical protein
LWAGKSNRENQENRTAGEAESKSEMKAGAGRKPESACPKKQKYREQKYSEQIRTKG